MFRFFKKPNNDREVTTNPKILYNSNISTSEIKVHGLKLQDSAYLIPLEKVSTTTFEKPPTDIIFPNGSGMSWKDNKVYYQSSRGEKEYLLAHRLKSVLEFGGIIHMQSGAKYVVQKQIIIGIGIHGSILKPYQKIPKEKIEKRFGKASKVEEEYEQIDGQLWDTYFFYENRNMVISFFEPDRQIHLINIGQFPFGRNN